MVAFQRDGVHVGKATRGISSGEGKQTADCCHGAQLMSIKKKMRRELCFLLQNTSGRTCRQGHFRSVGLEGSGGEEGIFPFTSVLFELFLR